MSGRPETIPCVRTQQIIKYNKKSVKQRGPKIVLSLGGGSQVELQVSRHHSIHKSTSEVRPQMHCRFSEASNV
eukprot:5105767-Amphidinium_carterae.1